MKEETYQRAQEIKSQISSIPRLNVNKDGDIELSIFIGLNFFELMFFIGDDAKIVTEKDEKTGCISTKGILTGKTRDWMLAKIRDAKAKLLEQFDQL